MTLTRGVASGGRRDPRLFENRLYAYTVPFVWIVPLEEQEIGISLVVSSVERIPSASVDPMVKNFHWATCCAVSTRRSTAVPGRRCWWIGTAT